MEKIKEGKQEEITFSEFCKEILGIEVPELNEFQKNYLNQIVKNKIQVKHKFKPKFKPFKPRVREHWKNDATIKIQTLLETTENPKNSFTNKEKLINCKVEFPWGTSISTSFDHTISGKKELLEFIKKELYL